MRIMQKNYCTFLSDAKKSVKKVSFAFTLRFVLGIASAIADPEPAPTAPKPTPDLSQVAVAELQVLQKSSNNAYQIGDRINFSAEIKARGLENGEHLSLKVPEGSSKLEDQGWYVDPSSQFMGGAFRFIASPIQTGTLTLPTLLIVKDDQTVLARTSPFTAKVTGPGQNKENKAPELIEITPSSLPMKYWILFSLLGLILFLTLGYFIYRFIQNKKKIPPGMPTVKIDPDHIIALRKIDLIYQKYPFELVNLKPLAFGVSDTLKEFFSHRFKIDATEATTDEMLALLKKEALSEESLKEIRTLFQSLDLIKFTTSDHYRHLDEQNYLDYKTRANFIIQKWALAPQSPEVRP